MEEETMGRYLCKDGSHGLRDERLARMLKKGQKVSCPCQVVTIVAKEIDPAASFAAGELIA